MDQPTVRSEDMKTAVQVMIGIGQQLKALRAAVDTVTYRWELGLAVVVAAAGGPPVIGQQLNVVDAGKLGVNMANHIIENRPQDAGMEFDVAQALWNNTQSGDDPVLLASYLSTLREYVERGKDD